MAEMQIIKEEDQSEGLKMSESKDKPSQPAMMNKKRSIKKEIKKSDKYMVNTNFRSKFRRLQVNALQKKEGRKESDAIHSKVL